MSVFSDFLSGAATAAGSGLITGAVNDYYATKAAKRNFEYNELAAGLADQRTRKLYADLYSPQAQMQQIKEAGLSPSLYSGQLGGISGQAGAQGAGTSGVGAASTSIGIDPLSISQMKLNEAQAEALKADAENKRKQKELLELERQFKQIDFEKYSIDANMLMGYVADKDGNNKQSFAEIAGNCTSYEEFIKTLKEKGANGIESEQAQRTLRDIYKANQQLKSEIAILSEKEISANFQRSITNALNSTEFAQLNAQNAIQFLQTSISTNELSETQKNAWNKLISKLESKNPTLADIAVVLGMIVDRFAGQVNYGVNAGFNVKI